MDSIKGAALSGIQRAMADAAKNADQISKAYNPSNPEESTDIVEPAIALKQDRRQVEANVKVIKVSEDMDEAVLDIIA